MQAAAIGEFSLVSGSSKYSELDDTGICVSVPIGEKNPMIDGKPLAMSLAGCDLNNPPPLQFGANPLTCLCKEQEGNEPTARSLLLLFFNA